ncbi:hypothetical protein BH20ACI4_BH20ACI4_00300 [soil metagenome]
MNKDKHKFQILTFQLNIGKVEKICREFAVHRIETVLIKGLAAAVNYPEPSGRVFSDIDLAVGPADFERAKKLVRENKFNVDLHMGLRHLDTFEWDDLFKNSVFAEINKTPIRVLRAEDHLRVLCVHWLNDGGADRTRLWDIYFALQNKPTGFDWERFIGGVGEKRKKWLMTVILLARDYFGMKLDGLPSDFEKYEIPGWIKKEVEMEWGSDHRLTPLQQVLNDRKQFFRQVLKRLPPNALQAVVECEDFITDSPTISLYLRNISKRIKPSLRRLFSIEREN